MSIQWNRESILQLIELYRENPELWNPNDNNYHMKTYKLDAWKKIATKVNCEVDDVKQKITSLLSSFRREKLKIKRSTGTGKGRNSTAFFN